jgi:ketosteroid isomerase-like protein
MYEAFNVRDIDGVLRQMTEDVDWPNAWEGGRVHGHDDARQYWTRQWSAINPTVKPVAFTPRPDGTIAVEVDQMVQGLDGTLLAGGRVLHVYTFRNNLIARMDVEELTRID